MSKILGEPPKGERGLVERVIAEVVPEGFKTFPEDFVEGRVEDEEMHEIVVPGTPLQLDPNFQIMVISPRQHFRYEAKNPLEAKYIIYACRIGQRKVKIPKDNRAVLRAVTSYEKYCEGMRRQCFTLFLEQTNDEDMAELLTKEVEQRLDLRAKRA